MPLGLWNLNWLNLNSQRKYPLADDADAVSESGDFTVPDEFIVELDLAVHAGVDVQPSRFFVHYVGAYATGYSVVVGYQPAGGGDPVDVATALIARQLHTPNKAYLLGGSGDFADIAGKIVIGRLDDVDLQPPGFHAFSLEHTRLDPDAIRPILRGVSSITVVNNGQPSVPLYGDIELVAGLNCQLALVLVDGQDPQIQINALRGEGLSEDCVCTGDPVAAPPLQSILGIKPTDAGDFFLAGDECLRLVPIANGLQIVDLCSKPCCSCADLEAITRDLERLRGEASTVNDFVHRLQTAVDGMNTAVLGSRLGSACFQCE